jgi:thioredoxin-like negative regulator of GroEL
VLERLLVLGAVGIGVAIGIALVRWYARSRGQRLRAQPGDELLQRLGARADGRHFLVAFSTPSCAACHTAQAPAVAAVQEQVGQARVRIVHVDAAHQPDIANAFGIMTVPSTVVLHPNGRVAAVNHGFTPSHQLVRQLQTA